MKPLIAFALSLCLFSPLSQAATLKIATLAPDGTNWMKLMRQAAKDIKAETDGRVKIKYFPGGVQGSDKSVLRKMRIRQLQGGAVSSGALNHISEMTQLYSLPFTFQNLEEVRAVRSEFDPYIIDSLAKHGYTVLGMTSAGFAYLMGNKPLTSIDDFKTQKVWSPEGDLITQTTFDNAGIEPISLPISDVYTSLQTGLINTVGSNLSAAIALQWHTKLTHNTDFPLLFLIGMLIVDQKSFEKLSTDDQAIVKRIMKQTYQAMDNQNAKDEAGARVALENSGMTFVQLSDEEKATWQALAAKTIKDLASKEAYPVEAYQKLQQRLTELRAGK